MALKSDYYSVSGPDHTDAYFLANRYEEEAGYVPMSSECWVVSVRARPGSDQNDFTTHLGSPTWFTALWRSATRACYVSDASGYAHRNPDLFAGDHRSTWHRDQLDASLHGIWGLDDGFVLTWGGRSRDEQVVYLWDGQRWSEMANPGFRTEAMHGIAKDLVYAVGWDGSVSLWDGSRWNARSAQTTEHLTSVFVAGPDEIYAAGSGGSIFEGSNSGWSRLGDLPGDPMPIQCVAKWGGHLWASSLPKGLHRRIGNTNAFESFKPKVNAMNADTRGSLVMACPTAIVSSADGNNFRGSGQDVLQSIRAGIPLMQF